KYYWHVRYKDDKGDWSSWSNETWFRTETGGGEPDFTISATPSSRTVVRGGSTTYTVSLTSQNGFNSSVSLGISGLPSGCTHNFNPGSVTPTGSSTLTVTTSTSTPTGTYTLTITGTGGGKTHSTQIELIVNESGSDPQIIMDSYSINYDSINNDGTVGPGEYAYFSITLENIGGSTAGGVTASIQTDDSYVDHYSTYSVSFGDITVGNTASSSSYDFYLHVSEACTDGHVIPFNITITDSQSHQWSDSFEITVIDNIGPSAYDCQVSPKITSKGSKVNISVYAEDSAGIRSVKALIKKSGDIIKLLTLYDDGNHNDGSSGDGIFGNSWTTLSEENDYVVDIRTTDNLGNMRYYAGMQGFTTKQWNKKSKILLVLDYQSSDTWIAYYYESALAENGYKYDTWLSFYRGAPNSSILNQYIGGVVIWSVPSYYNVELENSTVQSALESYLNSGGNLFISGQDIGYLTEHGDITSNFYNNYLHATYVQDDTGLYTLNGVSGDPISNGITLDISGGAGNQSWPSEIDPISPAVTIFTYNASSSASLEKTIPEIPFEENKKISAKVKAISSSGSGAIRVNTGTYKVVYFAFGFEGINSYDTRANLMGRIMSWLGLSSSTDTISITVKNQSNDPAESALVEIYSDTDSSPDMRGYTDVNGQIEFTLPVGTYTLVTSSEYDHFVVVESVSVPSSITVNTAGTVQISLNAKKKDGSALDTGIFASPLWGSLGGVGHTDSNGNITFNVTPGVYNVYAWSWGDLYYLKKENVNLTYSQNISFDSRYMSTKNFSMTIDNFSRANFVPWDNDVGWAPVFTLIGGESVVFSEGTRPISYELVYEDTSTWYFRSITWKCPFSEDVHLNVGGQFEIYPRANGNYIPGDTAEIKGCFLDEYGNNYTLIIKETTSSSGSSSVIKFGDKKLREAKNNLDSSIKKLQATTTDYFYPYL
ncbi:hypothetical protein DRN58_08720, partial [Thermococci archaeon]